MILVDKRSFWVLVFSFAGTAMPRIWRRVGVVTAIAVAYTVTERLWPDRLPSLSVLPFQLIAVPLGIFLGFQANTSFNRFWEARILWGGLVNTTRVAARQWLTLVSAPSAELEPTVRQWQAEQIRRVVAWVLAFRQQLREQYVPAELAALLPPGEVEGLEREKNRAIALLHRLGEELGEAHRRGWIHPMHVPSLDKTLTELTNIQGGCERIKSTPIPFSYLVLAHRIASGYCATLPIGIYDTVGVLTPVVVAIISYALFGLDAVGEEIEDPFQLDPNDLPLDAIARMVEINLRQRIGDPLPLPVAPVRHQLT